MASINFKGQSYDLATTLRVAYMIQGYNNHKPYAEILSNVNGMTIEGQLDVLYAAFAAANPDQTKFVTKEMFRQHYLDEPTFNLGTLSGLIKQVIAGLLGRSVEDLEADAAQQQGGTEGDAKNE